MARFHGLIGFATQVETAPGVWTEVIEEHEYRGDVIRNTKFWEKGVNLNDDLAIDNKFSIVADPYAYGNLKTMRYVKWLGTSWKITNFQIDRPRIILTVSAVSSNGTVVGGTYNETEN